MVEKSERLDLVVKVGDWDVLRITARPDKYDHGITTSGFQDMTSILDSRAARSLGEAMIKAADFMDDYIERHKEK